MAHEVESMAYAGQVPWHGLGKQVDPTISVEEMLVAAELDWKVRLLPCYAYDSEANAALPVGRQALVRDKDNKILTVTGDKWNPVQNAEALGFFKQFTDAGGATLETAGSLRGGRVIWGLASLHEQFTVGEKGDVVKGYLLLISFHEVGNATAVFTTTVRVVCANTMRMAEQGAGRAAHRQNHLSAFDPDLARKAIDLCRVQLGNAALEANALAQMTISEFDSVRLLARYFQPMEKDMQKASALKDATDKLKYDNFIDQLLSDTDTQSKALRGVINSINNAPGAQPETGWGVLNGVTHWSDHAAGRAADARLFNSWLGDRSRIKLAVNRDLLALAS